MSAALDYDEEFIYVPVIVDSSKPTSHSLLVAINIATGNNEKTEV